MTIIYRHQKGEPLTIAEMDGNFADLHERVTILETTPALAEGVASLTQERDQVTFHGTLGTVLGQIKLPKYSPTHAAGGNRKQPITSWIGCKLAKGCTVAGRPIHPRILRLSRISGYLYLSCRIRRHDMQNDDIEILARTLYGEARGEYRRLEGGLVALIAIGNVVMNRLKANSWYGNTIREVCQKPFQFSCWNEGNPNRKVVMQTDITDGIFLACQHVAAGVASGHWPDLTQGCNHYFATTLPDLPHWAKGQMPKLRLGRHIFYKLEG